MRMADATPMLRRPGLMAAVAERLGRNALIMGLGSVSVFPFSLLSVAIVTRYLDPDAYGQLSVYFVFAGLLAVAMNLVILHGTLMFVFGGGDDDVGIDADEAVDVGSLDRRVALGTGLMATLLLIGVISATCIIFAAELSQMLVSNREHAAEVRVAVLSAATGSVWRLTSNVLRMERRVVLYALALPLRPLAVLCVTVPLVAAGHGVRGALWGTTIGTTASVLVVAAVTYRSYRLRFDPRALRAIAAFGARFVPMVVGIQISHEVDVLILAHYASDASVGFYRVASRLSSLISYAASAMLMAWTPLQRTSLWRAAGSRHGHRHLNGVLTTYYLVGALSLSLMLVLGSQELVEVLAPGYHGAVDLVGITALGYVAFGLLLVMFRVAQHPHRMLVRGIAAMCSAILVVTIGVLLSPPLGAYGAGLGSVLGPLLTCVGIALYGHRHGGRLGVRWDRVATAAVLAAGGWALGRHVAPMLGDFSVVGRLLVAASYILLVMKLGVVPDGDRAGLKEAARGVFRPRRGVDELIGGVEELPTQERQAVLAFTRDDESVATTCRRIGVSEERAQLLLVEGLRRLTGGPPGPRRFDLELADVLVGGYVPAQRDSLLRKLWDEGMDAVDSHQIEDAFVALQGVPQRWWAAHVLLPPVLRPEGLGRAELDALADAARGRADGVAAIGPLCHLAGVDHRPETDRLVAAFLIAREINAQQLWAAGVDPHDVLIMDRVLARLASFDHDDWARLRQSAGVDDAVPLKV